MELDLQQAGRTLSEAPMRYWLFKSEPDSFSWEKLKAKGGTWTIDDLNQFINNPRAYLPGTNMTTTERAYTSRIWFNPAK